MIYLISRIKPEAHGHNERIAECASELYKQSVFIPHKHNPFNTPHKKIQLDVFNEDLNAMQQSNIGVVCLPIGNDCSGELGWYAGNSKYVSAVIIDTDKFSAKEQFESLESDWMLKGFLSDVTTNSIEVFESLKKDPILQYKAVLI